MSTASLHIALISETFAPEINGVANTLGRLVEACSGYAFSYSRLDDAIAVFERFAEGGQ